MYINGEGAGVRGISHYHGPLIHYTVLRIIVRNMALSVKLLSTVTGLAQTQY